MKKFRAVIITAICVCICVGYYYYLSNRPSGKEKQLTEVQKVIQKDIELAYPKTPREVVKFYNRIERCFYSQECTEEEFQSLGYQARKLMDAELLENNPETEYFIKLKDEIEQFTKKEKQLVRISVSSGNEVEYKKKDGFECAYVNVSYFMKVNKGTNTSVQTFILRKSEDGKWKILGSYQ